MIHVSVVPCFHPRVLYENVATALRSCKRGKSCGHDNIYMYYEHFIHGGPIVLYVFTNLYNAEYVPPDLNKAIIVTIHKGAKEKGRSK